MGSADLFGLLRRHWLYLCLEWAGLAGGVAAIGQAVRGNNLDEFVFTVSGVPLLAIGVVSAVRSGPEGFFPTWIAFFAFLAGIDNWDGLIPGWVQFAAPIVLTACLAGLMTAIGRRAQPLRAS